MSSFADNTLTRVANLVIAGTVKGGTTSLFAYLMAHEEICGSKNKETCYFLPKRYGADMQPWQGYEWQFDHCGNEKYILEATPGYFEGGEQLATFIKESIGDDVRIIITLRNPVDRLLSFVKYKKAQMELERETSISDYIEICSRKAERLRRLQKNDRYWGMDGGRYIKYLPGWFSVIEPDNLKIIFFDDIVNHPEQVMINLCEWLRVSPDIYRDMDFGVENKSVMYKFDLIHKLAIHTNQKYESYLRQAPCIKKLIRDIYYFINGEPSAKSANSKYERERLEVLYLDENRLLASYLLDRGYTDLPAWLSVHLDE